jgi:hypothetical protein
MRRGLSIWLAMVTTAVFTAQPVLASPPAGEASVSTSVARPAAPAVQPPADDGRRQVYEQLLELGRAPGSALDAALRLNAEDLNVLLAHPEMMQAAGASSSVTTSIILGLLIIAGLIALAAAGDGFIVRN